MREVTSRLYMRLANREIVSILRFTSLCPEKLESGLKEATQ